MTFCSKCGAEIPEGSKFCAKCGTPVNGDPSGKSQQPEQQHDIQPTGSNGHSGMADNGHGLAVGSLVCGIIAVVCWFFGYGSFLSIVLGIVGLVLAGNAKKAGNDEGMRTAGFVLSLLGLIGGIIVFFYLVVVLAFVGATAQGLFNLLR
jgi:hypothetical protein